MLNKQDFDDIFEHFDIESQALFVETSDMGEWLHASNVYIDKTGHRLVSPGGAAAACGVTRQAIFNWYMRDHKVSVFICRLPNTRNDSYVLVDLEDALSAAGLDRAQGEPRSGGSPRRDPVIHHRIKPRH